MAVVLVTALFACTLPLQAQTNNQNSAKLKQQLQDSQKQLKESLQRKQSLESNIGSLEKELQQLNADLIDSAAKAKKSEASLSTIEADLDRLSNLEKKSRDKLSAKNRSISRLLGAMQRIGRNPPPVIITERKDALRMVRSAMLLARAFPEFRGQAERLRAELNNLLTLLAEQRSKRAELQHEVTDYQATSVRLGTLKEQKRGLLTSRNKELTDVQRNAKLATQNVKSLTDLIASNDKLVQTKTRLGKYEEELARLPSRPAQPQPPGAQNKRTRVASISPSTIGPAVELVPRGKGRAANPGRLQPAIPFQRAKAKLPLPAFGEQVIHFGQRTTQGGNSKGLVIKTRHGAQITSPCDGWVVYAGSFRSYGQLLIINAGGGYHVLLANLSRLDVQLGQFVLAAEPVGSMAMIERRSGKSNAPVLYVEFRKNGKPIDPSPWWASGQRRVEG